MIFSDDSFSYNNGRRYDNDNYGTSSKNCAAERSEGWRYDVYSYVYLSSLYYFGGTYSLTIINGIEWYHWYNRYFIRLKQQKWKYLQLLDLLI